MFGRPLLHSRYQLRGYHASFGTSTNRYKFSSDDGNMSSVNVVVVDNNEADSEALSSCEKKKKSWCDFWPLWKSNNWAKLDTHTTSSKWSLTIWDTAVSRKNWNFTQQNHYTLGRKLKNGFAFQKDHLATTKFNFKSGEEDVEDWLWKKKVVWCQSPQMKELPWGSSSSKIWALSWMSYLLNE